MIQIYTDIDLPSCFT